MERGGGGAPRGGGVRDGGCVARVAGHSGSLLGDGCRSGSHAFREAVPIEVAELPELEAQRGSRVDEGGRPTPPAQVQAERFTVAESCQGRVEITGAFSLGSLW